MTDRAAFDAGQQGWAALRDLPGFIGQGGGWSRDTAGLAHIVGFWEDPLSYQTFMERTHDRVAAAQAGTYDQVRIRVLAARLTVGDGLPGRLAAVSSLRLVHCQVRTDRPAHVVPAQAEVWNPGTAAASGMCGVVFAQGGDSEFLVLSAWRTARQQRGSLDEGCRRLRERAGLTGELTAVDSDLVDLEPTWTVQR